MGTHGGIRMRRTIMGILDDVMSLAPMSPGRGRWLRYIRRDRKQSNYHANGLNGPRAMARRARQAERIEIKGEIRAVQSKRHTDRRLLTLGQIGEIAALRDQLAAV